MISKTNEERHRLRKTLKNEKLGSSLIESRVSTKNSIRGKTYTKIEEIREIRNIYRANNHIPSSSSQVEQIREIKLPSQEIEIGRREWGKAIPFSSTSSWNRERRRERGSIIVILYEREERDGFTIKKKIKGAYLQKKENGGYFCKFSASLGLTVRR